MSDLRDGLRRLVEGWREASLHRRAFGYNYMMGYDDGQAACADQLDALLASPQAEGKSASCHACGGEVVIGEAVAVYHAGCDPQAAGCVWKQDESSMHETGCGHVFQFTDDGAKENGAKFCCYCGKPLIEVLYTWDACDDEDELLPPAPETQEKLPKRYDATELHVVPEPEGD